LSEALVSSRTRPLGISDNTRPTIQFFPEELLPLTNAQIGRWSKRETVTTKSTNAFFHSPTRPAFSTAAKYSLKKYGDCSSLLALASAGRGFTLLDLRSLDSTIVAALLAI
jgi:hypothetical protein